MDFHSLTRKELQTLCKKNKIPANMTNDAMADALKALKNVEGIEDVIVPTTVSENPQSAAESPQKTENRSPDLPKTCRRTSTRRKPVKDLDVLIENEPPSSLLGTRTLRSTRRRTVQEKEQEKENPNILTEKPAEDNVSAILQTPIPQNSRRRTTVVASRQRVNTHIKEDKGGKDEKQEENPPSRVYNTRRSTRLSGKKLLESTQKKGRGKREAIKISALSEEESQESEKKEIDASEKSDASEIVLPGRSPKSMCNANDDVQEDRGSIDDVVLVATESVLLDGVSFSEFPAIKELDVLPEANNHDICEKDTYAAQSEDAAASDESIVEVSSGIKEQDECNADDCCLEVVQDRKFEQVLESNGSNVDAVEDHQSTTCDSGSEVTSQDDPEVFDEIMSEVAIVECQSNLEYEYSAEAEADGKNPNMTEVPALLDGQVSCQLPLECRKTGYVSQEELGSLYSCPAKSPKALGTKECNQSDDQPIPEQENGIDQLSAEVPINMQFEMEYSVPDQLQKCGPVIEQENVKEEFCGEVSVEESIMEINSITGQSETSDGILESGSGADSLPLDGPDDVVLEVERTVILVEKKAVIDQFDGADHENLKAESPIAEGLSSLEQTPMSHEDISTTGSSILEATVTKVPISFAAPDSGSNHHLPLQIEVTPKKSSNMKPRTPLQRTIKVLEDDEENIDNSARKLGVGSGIRNAKLLTVVAEEKENKNKGEEIAQKALKEISLRQLRKMFKEKLQIEGPKNNDNNKEQQLGRTRTALQDLTGNQLASEGKEN
ncbi:PREDICTED: uncharacterized protein LOC104587273 [Nelumbo nucifera]|uniref:Uncharacterized protein LOC104587273 n=2 Tax=Nelumbo nucifera TaxID=4432 RepID=A0A1U7YV25_NELNU|nr:PREDICTED: uncharacterized protein LOC104587273 [Nelumbo nucifera]DAD19282.1 TPA_asm: hypothetical protein HUJ06_020745 [Nelumbo nucifera]